MLWMPCFGSRPATWQKVTSWSGCGGVSLNGLRSCIASSSELAIDHDNSLLSIAMGRAVSMPVLISSGLTDDCYPAQIAPCSGPLSLAG